MEKKEYEAPREMDKMDVLIYWAKLRIENSRKDLVYAQEKHDKNVKHLRELMDEKFPETVGHW